MPRLKEVNGQLHESLLSGDGGTGDILSQTPLAECLEQLATMSWSSSGKCQTEPVAVQGMMKTLVSRKNGFMFLPLLGNHEMWNLLL